MKGFVLVCLVLAVVGMLTVSMVDSAQYAQNDQVTCQDSGQAAFVDSDQGAEVACIFRGRKPLRRAGVGVLRLIGRPFRAIGGC